MNTPITGNICNALPFPYLLFIPRKNTITCIVTSLEAFGAPCTENRQIGLQGALPPNVSFTPISYPAKSPSFPTHVHRAPIRAICPPTVAQIGARRLFSCPRGNPAVSKHQVTAMRAQSKQALRADSCRCGRPNGANRRSTPVGASATEIQTDREDNRRFCNV